MTKQISLANYFEQWMVTFKKPAISPVTYVKYTNTYHHILAYYGDTKLQDLSRHSYQTGINNFAQCHAKRTVAGFHKQIRAAILDAVEDGLIKNDFTRKAIITGREKKKDKETFLSYSEWQVLVKFTSTHSANSLNFIIYLSAMTGLRYAEVLALTVSDIDLKDRTLTVRKTWDYKYHTGFKPTKNTSSLRSIDLDVKTAKVIKQLLKLHHFKEADQKICVDYLGKLPASATINRYLEQLCHALSISSISFHGLRHTHASILLFKGVNILSVSKRLGHKDVTTTQTVYLHVIKEMEERETKLITKIMSDAQKE